MEQIVKYRLEETGGNVLGFITAENTYEAVRNFRNREGLTVFECDVILAIPVKEVEIED